MQSCESLKKIVGVGESTFNHRPTVFPIVFPPGTCAAKSIILGLFQEGSQRWIRLLLSSPSHLIRSSSLIVGCQVTFAIGAWNIITDRRIFIPTSHIQITVDILSVLVAKSVPELSNDIIFVPVLVFDSLAGGGPEVGGQIVCDACMNSRPNPPFWAGMICSCQICKRQLTRIAGSDCLT